VNTLISRNNENVDIKYQSQEIHNYTGHLIQLAISTATVKNSSMDKYIESIICNLYCNNIL